MTPLLEIDHISRKKTKKTFSFSEFLNGEGTAAVQEVSSALRRFFFEKKNKTKKNKLAIPRSPRGKFRKTGRLRNGEKTTKKRIVCKAADSGVISLQQPPPPPPPAHPTSCKNQPWYQRFYFYGRRTHEHLRAICQTGMGLQAAGSGRGGGGGGGRGWGGLRASLTGSGSDFFPVPPSIVQCRRQSTHTSLWESATCRAQGGGVGVCVCEGGQI